MLVKTKMAGLIMAVVALSAPLVYADNGSTSTGGGNPSHQAGGMHHLMARVLNLTEDQQKQLKDIHKKQKEAMKSVFEQMKSNREAFYAEITKATPDMNKINDFQAQLKTIQAQMVDNHLNSLLEIKKIMSPEQFAGFMTLEKERKLMRHMMMHNKFGRKDGFGQHRDGHKQWADKSDGDHDSDSQD